MKEFRSGGIKIILNMRIDILGDNDNKDSFVNFVPDFNCLNEVPLEMNSSTKISSPLDLVSYFQNYLINRNGPWHT